MALSLYLISLSFWISASVVPFREMKRLGTVDCMTHRGNSPASVPTVTVSPGEKAPVIEVPSSEIAKPSGTEVNTVAELTVILERSVQFVAKM